MKILSWPGFLAGQEKIDEPVRLTIGVFDGLHVGHRELMTAIVRSPGPGMAVVVTFPKNPVQVLAPSRFPGLILSYRQKLARLSELGVGAVVAVDFSEEMSNLSGKAFIALLRDNLVIEKIVVGENFRFGRSREAGSGDLKEMLVGSGIEVQVSQPVLRGNAIVSSSRIRKNIHEADFAEARAMLLADYSVDLRDLGGRAHGVGAWRFDRAGIEQILPRPGRYAVTAEYGEKTLPAELTVLDDSIVLAAEAREQASTIVFH